MRQGLENNVRVLLRMPLACVATAAFFLLAERAHAVVPWCALAYFPLEMQVQALMRLPWVGAAENMFVLKIRFGDEAREFEFETLKAVTSNSPCWTTAKGRSTSSLLQYCCSYGL